MSMNWLRTVLPFLSKLSDVDLAKVAAIAVISIPVALIFAFYKMNKAPKEKPVSVEEAYGSDHLFI